MLLSVTNFLSGKTVQYQIVTKAGVVSQAWTSTGVTEQVIDVTAGKSTYLVDNTAIDWTTFQGTIMWKDNSATPYTASSLWTAEDNFMALALLPRGVVATNALNTSQYFQVTLAAADFGGTLRADCIRNTWLTFTSGSNMGESRQCIGYDNTTGLASFMSGYYTIPTAGDTFKIVNT